MAWWGKLLGGTFGFLIGGPLGALLGGVLGHNFDKGMSGLKDRPSGWQPGDQERVQTAFFTATFSVMGHLAKADGTVSRDEIRLAESVMAQMQLAQDMRRAAMGLFEQGKAPDFDLDGVVEQFRRECHRRTTLLQMFLEIQLQAAYADGELHHAEEQLLLRICRRLGIPEQAFRHLEMLVRAQYAAAGGSRPGAARVDAVQEAYGILDLPENASDAEVKKAYRRLMSQHHPDKLVSKGLPEEMVELANQKTHEIRKAYETVKDARGMR